MRYTKIVPIINAILVALFAYYVHNIIEKFKGLPEYNVIFKVLIIPVILLVIVVIISIILYWIKPIEK